MEIKEAIDILLDTDLTCYGYSKKEVDEAGNMGVEALEKQIPKLVDTIPGDYTSDYICTVCGETTRFEHQKYCVECGQRLEW